MQVMYHHIQLHQGCLCILGSKIHPCNQCQAGPGKHTRNTSSGKGENLAQNCFPNIIHLFLPNTVVCIQSASNKKVKSTLMYINVF